MVIRQVVLYKDYACNKCGSIKIDLFEAEDSFCFKCRSCNHNFIVPRNVKQKAKEEGRKEGAITFCKSLIERFEKERIVLENERIVLEQTMRQNHYTDLDFSNALINIGKLLQLKEVLKEIKGSEKVNE
mgnify:CR=1 FL=1